MEPSIILKCQVMNFFQNLKQQRSNWILLILTETIYEFF